MSPTKQTYRATLAAPLHYSSNEGNAVETSPRLSATALAHALGYDYYGLGKYYVLTGDDATTPAYERLSELPFFVTDMTPLDVERSQKTFRTTTHTGEYNITTGDNDVAGEVNGNKGIPRIKNRSGSMSAWKAVRRFVGIAPGSEYEFTIWSTEPLPEQLSFQMGIKRTGQFRATEVKSESVDHTVNKYLLENVYELSEDTLTQLLRECDRFNRGSDPRLHQYIGVETATVESTILPQLFS